LRVGIDHGLSVCWPVAGEIQPLLLKMTFEMKPALLRMAFEMKPASRKVDVRLPGKGKSNSHGARPVHLIITITKWIRTSRLSTNKELSLTHLGPGEEGASFTASHARLLKELAKSQFSVQGSCFQKSTPLPQAVWKRSTPFCSLNNSNAQPLTPKP